MLRFLCILIGVLLVILGALTLYGGYDLQIPPLAALGFGSIIIGTLATLFGISHKTSNKKENILPESSLPEEIIPDKQKEQSETAQAEIKALIQSMGVVAVADKRIRQEEVDTIIRIYSETLGLRITNEEVREILQEFDDHFDIEERLKAIQFQISPMMKRTIILSCQKVMVSDLEIAPSEQTRILEIGLALGLKKDEIDLLIKSANP